MSTLNAARPAVSAGLDLLPAEVLLLIIRLLPRTRTVPHPALRALRCTSKRLSVRVATAYFRVVKVSKLTDITLNRFISLAGSSYCAHVQDLHIRLDMLGAIEKLLPGVSNRFEGFVSLKCLRIDGWHNNNRSFKAVGFENFHLGSEDRPAPAQLLLAGLHKFLRGCKSLERLSLSKFCSMCFPFVKVKQIYDCLSRLVAVSISIDCSSRECTYLPRVREVLQALKAVRTLYLDLGTYDDATQILTGLSLPQLHDFSVDFTSISEQETAKFLIHHGRTLRHLSLGCTLYGDETRFFNSLAASNLRLASFQAQNLQIYPFPRDELPTPRDDVYAMRKFLSRSDLRLFKFCFSNHADADPDRVLDQLEDLMKHGFKPCLRQVFMKTPYVADDDDFCRQEEAFRKRHPQVRITIEHDDDSVYEEEQYQPLTYGDMARYEEQDRHTYL